MPTTDVEATERAATALNSAPPAPPTGWNLDAALAYHGRGWAVLPLCPPDHHRCSDWHREQCGSPGKAPLISWQIYQQRLPTEHEIRAWFRSWPSANVGVAAGPVSRLVALDVDGEQGEELLNQWAEGEELPTTNRFETGREGSYRLLYRTPIAYPVPHWPLQTPDGATAMTIIGEGGQTVMPSSVHEHGRIYRWATGLAPSQFEIADAPEWMLAKLHRRHQDLESGVARGQGRYFGDGEPIRQSGRNNTLCSLGGAVRRFGCTEEEIRALLFAVNNRCDPPLALHEVNTVVRSMMKYPPADVPSLRQIVEINNRPSAACLIEMQDVEPRRVDWVWPQWIPAGSLVCLDGDGGVGKSTLALDLAARITRGDAWPDGSRPDAWEGPQNVLIICCEDSIEKTIQPRLNAARADLSRVSYLEEVTDPKTSETRQLELPRDIPTLEAVIAEKQIKFVVIDPILAFMGSDGDYSRDQDVRRTISPFKRIADSQNCTFLYIRHWNKGSAGSQASYRGGGSLAWVNVARAAFCCGHSPDREGCGEFHWTKSNLAPRQQGWVYQTIPLESGVTRVEWLHRSERSADEIANGVDDEDGTGRSRGQERRQSAQNAQDEREAEVQSCAHWIVEHLSTGPQPARESEQAARAAGFSPWQIRQARAQARVESRRVGGFGREGYQAWALPTPSGTQLTIDLPPGPRGTEQP